MPIPVPVGCVASEVVARCRACSAEWVATVTGETVLDALERAGAWLAPHRGSCAGLCVEPYVLTNDPEILQMLGALSAGPRGTT